MLLLIEKIRYKNINKPLEKLKPKHILTYKVVALGDNLMPLSGERVCHLFTNSYWFYDLNGCLSFDHYYNDNPNFRRKNRIKSGNTCELDCWIGFSNGKFDCSNKNPLKCAPVPNVGIVLVSKTFHPFFRSIRREQ